MKIELDLADTNALKIKSYSDNSFTVNDEIIETNIIISRERVIDHWLSDGYSHFATQHLDEIISWQPEIIILGTGSSLSLPAQDVTAYVNARQIGFEIMDTGAACRSYNLLIDEGRNVVACLFLSGS